MSEVWDVATTHKEFIEDIWPGLTEEEAVRLLWNATCFPFGTREKAREQLCGKYEQSGGDIDKAIEIAHQETDAAMGGLRR